MSQELVGLLDAAQEEAGVPFPIFSAIRCPERNKTVGGVSDSAHVKGCVVDIGNKVNRHRALVNRAQRQAGLPAWAMQRDSPMWIAIPKKTAPVNGFIEKEAK